MEAVRTRPSFAGDWLAVAIFLLVGVLVGSLVVRELRVDPRMAAAESQPRPVEPAIPADAVAVPSLALGADGEIRIGDPADVVVARLRAPTVVSESVEQGTLGLRLVRAYELAGTRFLLVLEPFERNGQLRVSAIYLR